MRHRRKGSRLNRKSNQLKALLRNLVTSLVINGQMVTTISKAKALIPVFDRLVINVRKNDAMNSIRVAQKILFGKTAQQKFVQEIVPALEGRPSGFCSVLKIGARPGDNAQVVRIQILTADVVNAKESKLSKSSTKTKTVKKEEVKKTTPKKVTSKKTATKSKTASKTKKEAKK